MFVGRIAMIVTATCAVIGAAAFVGIFLLTIAGGSEYLEFILAMVFFTMFLIGSYWWIVLGPGRRL
jgi:hypothetical protein